MGRSFGSWKHQSTEQKGFSHHHRRPHHSFDLPDLTSSTRFVIDSGWPLAELDSGMLSILVLRELDNVDRTKQGVLLKPLLLFE